MNCERVKTELAPLLYGDLDPGHRAEVESHLAECESCSRELDELREVVQCLKQRPNLTSDPGLAPGLARRPDRPTAMRLRRWAGIGVAAAAAVALVFALIGTEVEYADGRLTLTLSLAPQGEPATPGILGTRALVRAECRRQLAPKLDELAASIEKSRKQQEERLLALAGIVESEVNADLASLGSRIQRTAADVARANTAVENLVVAFLGTIEDTSDLEARGGAANTAHN